MLTILASYSPLNARLYASFSSFLPLAVSSRLRGKVKGQFDVADVQKLNPSHLFLPPVPIGALVYHYTYRRFELRVNQPQTLEPTQGHRLDGAKEIKRDIIKKRSVHLIEIHTITYSKCLSTEQVNA